MVTVLSLGAVGLVWYSLSWLSVLSNVFQIDGLLFNACYLKVINYKTTIKVSQNNSCLWFFTSELSKKAIF